MSYYILKVNVRLRNSSFVLSFGLIPSVNLLCYDMEAVFIYFVVLARYNIDLIISFSNLSYLK